MPKAIVLGIRFSEAEYAALAAAAEADQRSMSAKARMLVVDWLRANGYPPATAKTAAPAQKRPRTKPKPKAAPAAVTRHAARLA